ncbi:MAG: hypothetical protein RLW61_01645 [Gammaproteobacteria bacterium]
MPTRLHLVPALLLAASSSTAGAADAAGNYAIWGAGSRSCHQFERARDDSTALASFRDYLMGYLTAYNTLAPQTYDALGGLSLEDALAWVDDYCDLHKIDSFERAVAQLIVSRHDARSRGHGSSSGSWGRPATGGDTP